MSSVDYYLNRMIDKEYYDSYKLPKYLLNILSKLDLQKNILDIGCGPGRMLSAIKNRGFKNICGIDINDKALDICRQVNIPVKQISNIKTFESSVKYDLIIMNHVLEHIEKQQVISTLKHIRTNLLNNVPNSGLFISVPNAQSNTNSYWAYEDFTHSTIFTSGSLIYVLKESGFKNISFIDIDSTAELSFFTKKIRKLFLKIYKSNKKFWNKITASSYHKPSPDIFSYEIKVFANN